MSLLELRSAGSHRGLSSRWSLAYSSCWAGVSFSTGCFTIPIHPIIIYMILSFVNSKRYLVDWNGRRRLLENTDQFSSCDVMLPEPSMSFANSMSLQTPYGEAHGASS